MPGWNESLWFSFLAGVALKSVVVLGAAWAVAFFMRGRSAAVRHIVWTAAFGALLLLPLLSVALPALPAPGTGVALAPEVVFRADAGVLEPQANIETDRGPGGLPRADWRAAMMWAWAIGSAALLLQMLAGLAHMQRLRLHARSLPENDLAELAGALGIRQGVDAFETAPGRMPMSFGMLRPAVFMPADSAEWSEERRRVVLLHELAHVRRGDHAKHLLARAALCLYWWNPLAWLAWRAFLKERERAADDLVLAVGARAADYAGHLLEIARAMRSAPTLGAAAVAMARRSQLEGRLLAILDSARNRTAPGRAAAVATALICAAIVIPLAALRAQDDSQELRAGVTALNAKRYDEAFDRFQRAQFAIPAKAAEAAMWQAVVRERQGRDQDADSLYRLALSLSTPDTSEQATILELYARLLQRQNRPDEAADMRARAAKLRVSAPPAAAQFARAQATSGMAAASGLPAPPLPPPPPTATSQSGTLDGLGLRGYSTAIGATPPRVIRRTEPAYSEAARKAGLQGAVVLSVDVGSDGRASNIRVQHSLGLGLDEQAIEAVRQWVFQPATKNGQPVTAGVTVQVNFRLSQQPAPVEGLANRSAQGVGAGASEPFSGIGGGVFRVGGGVTAPTLLSKVEPEYTEAARAAALQGAVVLYIEVDPTGRANNIRVQRALGMGLDEMAIEAVRQWRFTPGKKDGQPVTVAATIEVNFRLPSALSGGEAVVGSGAVFPIGSGVTPPRLLQKVEPEYTEDARAAKYEGSVTLYVEVGPDGVPQKIEVKRGLGLGLDQKAVEAVSKWRFQPGMRFGVPVTVAATVEVRFRLL